MLVWLLVLFFINLFQLHVHSCGVFKRNRADVEGAEGRKICQYKTCVARYDAAFKPRDDVIKANECIIQHRKVYHFYTTHKAPSSLCPTSEDCKQKSIKRIRCRCVSFIYEDLQWSSWQPATPRDPSQQECNVTRFMSATVQKIEYVQSSKCPKYDESSEWTPKIETRDCIFKNVIE